MTQVTIEYQYGVTSEQLAFTRIDIPVEEGRYKLFAPSGDYIIVDVYRHEPTGKLCCWDDDIQEFNFYDQWQSYDYAGHVCVEWIDAAAWQKVQEQHEHEN